MNSWHFGSTVGKERADALLQAVAFAAVVEAIAQDMEILCCHRRCCDDLAGFSRVIFNLRVPQSTFDIFFNSEHGYRGAYFDSPYAGLAANGACIQRLTPPLLAWANQHEPSVDQVFARESLASPTAKVWLTEFESHICEKCVGEWGNPTDEAPEICNGRWEFANAPGGRHGRKAPFLSKLRVFGAFLNERHDEFTPARKRHRAEDLNKEGWS